MLFFTKSRNYRMNHDYSKQTIARAVDAAVSTTEKKTGLKLVLKQQLFERHVLKTRWDFFAENHSICCKKLKDLIVENFLRFHNNLFSVNRQQGENHLHVEKLNFVLELICVSWII